MTAGLRSVAPDREPHLEERELRLEESSTNKDILCIFKNIFIHMYLYALCINLKYHPTFLWTN